MRVTCENCSTKFNLDESRVKTTGSKVRCSKCKHIFTVYPPQAEDEPAEEPVLDLEDPEHAASDSLPADDTLPEDADPADDLDLSDIEKMLEMDESPDVPEAHGEDALSGDLDDSLDLSDFEKILEDADDDELMEEPGEEDQDLVFDLDEDTDLQAGEEQLSPTTELDLGDLEKMFESEDELSLDLETESGDDGLVLPEVGEDAPVEEMVPGAETELLGFDVASDLEEEATGDDAFSLELEPEIDGEETADSGDVGGEEDLGLELEPETDKDTSPGETPIGELEGLGLELEPDSDAETSAEEASVADVEDLGLELESDMDVEAPPEEASAVGVEDLGLELEPDLDEEEPFAIESEEAADAADADLAEQLEMAMETPGDESAADEDLAPAADDGENGLPDFNDEAAFPDDAVPDIPDEDDLFDDDEVEESPGDEAEEYEEVEVAQTKGVFKKVLFWVLGALLVVVVALAVLGFLNKQGILSLPLFDRLNIPFLSQSQGRGTDSGNLKIITSDVDSRFLENDKAGRMFVVTGKVKNDYGESRSHIQISGSLYTRGKTLADTATAYCGNIIADLELSQMTPAAVRTRLGTPAGDNNTNVNVPPGEERPFMIVFFNLPESLDEFTVAVRSSMSGDK